MQNIVLEVKDITKRIGNKTIIKNVSFEVYSGETLGIIGPNGAGKTTIIRSILGLISLNKGSININNINIKKDYEKAISKIGCTIENSSLYKFMSGYDNLMQFARLYDNLDKAKIDEIINLIGLYSRIMDKVSKYSFGMKQRLSIGQALLHSPNLLILDEPTNGLDPGGIKWLREYLITLSEKQNTSIVISSHLLSEIENICNRAIIVNDGKIVETIKIDRRKMKTETFLNIENKYEEIIDNN